MQLDKAAKFLESLFQNGSLKSEYEAYVNTQIRSGNSFYTRIVQEENLEEAEKVLAQWEYKLRMSDYAASIEPVAKGMLSIAKIGTSSSMVHLIDVTDRLTFPTAYLIANPSQMVVVFNRQSKGCACTAPVGSSDWSPGGRLGLKAVTLQSGRNFRTGVNTSQLGLVFSQKGEASVNNDGFTVVTIEPVGFTSAHRYSPHFYPDSYLAHSLGVFEAREAFGCAVFSGGFSDNTVGLSGSNQVVADALPKLGEYLTGLAQALSEHGACS